MDTLRRFGIGDELYTFEEDEQISLRDNFRDVVSRTSRLPGLSGAYNEFGTGPAPNENGNVRVEFWLQGDTAQALQTKLESMAAMEAWGTKRLVKWSYGGGEERYCEAYVQNIDFNMNVRDVPHKRLRIAVNFGVDNPVWLGGGTYTGGFLWGDGTLWGSGAKWGGTPDEQALTGTENTFSVTPAGNKLAYPIIRVEVPSGKQAENVRVQRLVSARVVDEIKYTGVLSAGDIWEVDASALQVRLNWVDGYGDAFSFESPAWFRLRGGIANSIRVLMQNATDEATVRFEYHDAYNV